MKYDCDACGPELGSYLLGDVAAAVRREINTHLAACPACRNELERERELRAGLASLPLATCPDDVSARVLAVVGRESVAARRGARRWLGAGAAAGLLAATLAAVLLLRPGSLMRTPSAGPAVIAAAGGHYTTEQVATARRELIQTLTMTARVLNQAGRSTFVDVFNDQLPSAVEGSLRPLDDPTRGG